MRADLGRWQREIQRYHWDGGMAVPCGKRANALSALCRRRGTGGGGRKRMHSTGFAESIVDPEPAGREGKAGCMSAQHVLMETRHGGVGCCARKSLTQVAAGLASLQVEQMAGRKIDRAE